MAKLDDKAKVFIVQALACYDTPLQVANSVAEEFGIAIDRSQVAKYDPTKPSGNQLSEKLRVIFDATRKAFLDDVSRIPVANQAYRLHKLQKVTERAERRGNDVLLMEALEQAAKEVGGLFTNKLKLGGDSQDPFIVWLQGIGNSSIPVVQDVEGETIEHDEPEKPTSAGKIAWKRGDGNL